MKRRILPILMSILMVFALLPVTAGTPIPTFSRNERHGDAPGHRVICPAEGRAPA